MLWVVGCGFLGIMNLRKDGVLAPVQCAQKTRESRRGVLLLFPLCQSSRLVVTREHSNQFQTGIFFTTGHATRQGTFRLDLLIYVLLRQLSLVYIYIYTPHMSRSVHTTMPSSSGPLKASKTSRSSGESSSQGAYFWISSNMSTKALWRITH